MGVVFVGQVVLRTLENLNPKEATVNKVGGLAICDWIISLLMILVIRSQNIVKLVRLSISLVSLVVTTLHKKGPNISNQIARTI